MKPVVNLTENNKEQKSMKEENGDLQEVSKNE